MRFNQILQIAVLLATMVACYSNAYAADKRSASPLVMTDMQNKQHTLAQYRG